MQLLKLITLKLTRLQKLISMQVVDKTYALKFGQINMIENYEVFDRLSSYFNTSNNTFKRTTVI